MCSVLLYYALTRVIFVVIMLKFLRYLHLFDHLFFYWAIYLYLAMNLAFSILQWIFIKACFVASYEFVKIKPRAISRFCGIFSPSFFSRSVWSHDPWCQPCKLRYNHGHVSYYLSHNRWDLYYTWAQMLLQRGPFLCLGSKCFYG